MTTTELLAGGYRMGRMMVHRMCDDLTEAEFRHPSVPGSNPAAWIVGHLAVVARRTAERIGATGLPVLTEEFIARYSATRMPAAEPGQLESKDELLSLLDTSFDKLIGALPSLPPEGLTGPTPNPGPFAANYGEALLFGVMHVMLHCGQLSTIRRSLGRPPLT